MHFVVPQAPYLGGIGEPMDPIRLIDQSIALGPTRVIADPSAGYATYQGTHLGNYRDALDAISAFAFLFP